MARKRRDNEKLQQDKEIASKQSARQERRNHLKKSNKDSGDEDVHTLKTQLAQFGLTLREVPGDGNCLFRALGDQLDGHMGSHLRHRRDTAQYMSDHRKDFEPFVEDEVPFDKHLSLLGDPGTYVGNDAIVAFARMHQVTVVIHQPNAPLWRVEGSQWEDSSRENERKLRSKQNQPKELHIAYHGGDHYDSVRKVGDTGHLPANIKLETSAEPQPKAKTTTAFPESHYCENTEIPDELTDLEKDAMDLSGCTDLFVVRQLLENNCYNLDATVEDLIGLTVSSASSETAATSLENKPLTTARRKQLPARKQERQKKVERKKRATEERSKEEVTEPQPIQTKFQCLSI